MEQGAFLPQGQRGRDAGLEDAVAGDDPAEGGVEHGPVERVGGGAHQLVYHTDGQAGIGIERDDIANPDRRDGGLAIDRQKRGVGGPAQEAVELMQLAAFALPAHPEAFAGVPPALSVEHEEASCSIFGIERGHIGHGAVQQPGVAG